MNHNYLKKVAYEEWELKNNSLPGYMILSNIINNIMEVSTQFNGWQFSFKKESGCLSVLSDMTALDKYKKKSKDEYCIQMKEFNDTNKKEYMVDFNNHIHEDIVFMIKMNESCHVEQLLSGVSLGDQESGYHLTSKGILDVSNLKSEVFFAPVPMGTWAQIGNGEVVLVIHHDGATLFTLRRTA